MVVGAGVAALVAGSTVSSATADPIADKKSQAQALAAQIDTLGRKEGALAEQYDGAVLQAQQTATQLQQAQQALTASQANAQKVRGVLQGNAVDAYVHGGSLAAVASRNSGGVTNGVLRGEYLRTLSQTESDALDAYHSAVAQQQEAKAALQSTQKAQNQALAKVNSARSATSAAEQQLQGTLNKVKGDLATLVAQAQAAQEAAALRVAQAAAVAREQRQQAAAAAAAAASRSASRPVALVTASNGSTSNGGGNGGSVRQPAAPAPTSGAPTPVLAPVAGSGRGGGAVAAAESRVGDPYVWGGGGPNVFDCSGLVMWAYAQVGVSLPHNAGAQYAMSQHIPMSALQPGDLVFAAGLGHVAMYVGGGMIVEALHTGTPVHIVPMWSFLVLAGRI